MKKIISSILFSLGLLTSIQASSSHDELVIKALLVTGGCCHDYPTQGKILPEGISARVDAEIDWTIVFESNETFKKNKSIYHNPDWAKGYDLVVHNECFAKIGDPELIENILKPHREGIPAVLVHCTMHCYRTGPTAQEWYRFCGVHSPNHGKKHALDVQITKPNHEIMQGLKDWTTPNGELYYIAKIFPNTIPLAQSKSNSNGKTYINIWVNAYGPQKTRVFATTIGHHNETMKQSEYLNMLTRGFLWATGERVNDFFIAK